MSKKDPNDFTIETIRTLAKRAGQRCSRPTCKRTTSGGNTKEIKATEIGKAAHIRGAHPNSARYDATMTPSQRSNISNGIWLCANCHDEIDRDEKKFPACLLFKWKKEHESSVLNLEPINPSLNIGGAVKTDFNGDNNNLTVINNIVIGTVSANYPDRIVKQAEVIFAKQSQKSEEHNLIITLSPFMGVVKSPELPGTRVQLEFAILNIDTTPKILKGVYVNLNGGKIHFKKFFKINENSSREPDFNKRFPIIIPSKGAERLAIEFENFYIPLINKGNLNGELVVLTGEEKIACDHFVFEVNDAMENALNLLQIDAIRNNRPIVFDAMIQN